jgi:membrane associated rhomboid family serine protease
MTFAGPCFQALQVSLFLGIVDLGWSDQSVNSICLSGHAILHRQEFRRLFTAALTHASDIHLYYNMVTNRHYRFDQE